MRAHAEMQIAHDFADKALSKDKNQLAGLLDNKPAGGGASNPGWTQQGWPRLLLMRRIQSAAGKAEGI